VTKSSNILIVEDDIAHVELLRRAIEDDTSDIELHICNNLHDARKSIKLSPPDVLIADLNLPDGKGLELIASSGKDNEYPLILMTSFGDENIAVEAMKSGAFDYIVKTPEAFKAMPKTIKRALRERTHIAAKHQAQKALLQKENEQREILNTILDGVITFDESGKILSFNKAAETLFYLTADEAIGQYAKQLLPESFENIYDQHLHRYQEMSDQGQAGLGCEITAQRNDNSTFPMRISIAELPNNSEGMRRFIASCQDLTQMKHQDEQLRRSQKMDALGKLTGGIAHDYNNLLSIILGYAEQLNDHLAYDSKLAKYAYEIERAAERGARLTKKLLSFCRNTIPDSKETNINKIFRDQKLMLEKTLTAKVQLEYDFQDNLWPVKLDRNDLEDAIVNMSINALHAMKSGGQLTINTRNEKLDDIEGQLLQLAAGDYVLLNVTDTGCGMDETVKERIFDPFYSTKGKLGTGLGLSQVYGFVERSGGVIKVYSESGHGSRFALYFPRSHKNINKDLTSESDTAKQVKGTETVLVVDDEHAIADLVHDRLTMQGYRVLTANDGEQALILLETENVDLIISDVIMPGMDGYQLAAQVQQLYPKIKIQMVSGFADDRHINMTNDVLQRELLYKPYSSVKLLKRIRTLLDNGNNI